MSLPDPAAIGPVLGIETSCDETAAALVDGQGRVLAQALHSQIADHLPYGGVVPEVAARAHLAWLPGLVAGVLDQARLGPRDLTAIAATAGPGLIGGVIVGVMTAKAMAAALGRPFLGINHLEAHALTARLTDRVAFPYLLLLVSGGHCQLVMVDGVGRHRLLGSTIDDAVGEAFDKTAKLLGLGLPGGPAVEQLAAEARDPGRYRLPRPLLGRAQPEFSFSGLKTAVRQVVEGWGDPAGWRRGDAADLCAAFQAAVGDVLADRLIRAMGLVAATPGWDGTVVVAGGVAANQALRAALAAAVAARGGRLVVPPPRLCTDNAVMVAWAGVERLALGLTDPLTLEPRPRWPLAELARDRQPEPDG